MASASDFAKKPHYAVEEPTPTIPQIPSKCHSNLHFKSIIIVLVLAAIPLFPSEAPSFISESIFPQLWEIIHLLFIAIAISYGLFSRKSTQIETESVSSRSDGFNAYLSGLFSVNEDGLENLSGFDEKITTQSIKNRSFVVSEDGFEKNIDLGTEKQVSQTWNYRYVEGESIAVVDNREYLVDEIVEYRPLNLPIRSLRSRIVDNDNLQLANRSDSYSTPSSSEDSCKNIDDKVKVQKIRGVVPKNLEKKFLEASVQPRPISWRSRSRLMETRDKMSRRVAHSRPLSVGESEFNHMEYDSFGDSKLASSPDLSKLSIKNVDAKKGLKRLPVPGSRSRVAPINAEKISVACSKARRPFSVGSSLEMNMLENSDTNLMESGKENADSFASDVKISKLLSGAKSVRTFRSNGFVEDEMKKEKSLTPIRTQDQDLNGDDQLWEPNPRVASNHKKRDSDDPNEQIGVKDLDDPNEEESEEDSGSEFETSSHSADDGTELDDASELDGSEVDRKAGEFIAKFRAQIRLQKASSVKGYSGR